MRWLALTVLITLLTVTQTATAAAEENGMSNMLTENGAVTQTGAARSEAERHPSIVSSPDLYLFGVISLGILGLFWIRRHTSEL